MDSGTSQRGWPDISSAFGLAIFYVHSCLRLAVILLTLLGVSEVLSRVAK